MIGTLQKKIEAIASMFACTHGMHWTRVACLCLVVGGGGVRACIYLDFAYVKGVFYVRSEKKYLVSKKGNLRTQKGPFTHTKTK